MKKTSRQLQKEQTREFLLKTAYEYFSEHGILNTRMSDIAQAAGVSHGTVFLHFATQEALVTEVVETYCGKIALRTHELAKSCTSIQEVLSAHLEGIKEYEPFYTRLVIENRLLPPAARDAWINIQSAVSFHFGRVLERTRGEKQVAALPVSALFNLWIGLIHHYLANGDLFAPDGKVLERHGDTLIEYYMKLIHYETEEEKHGREAHESQKGEMLLRAPWREAGRSAF